ncbi:MAG TPA: hypothetical protein VFX49_12475 [Chloroflexota bacterium]|nr:hypothetical protein [Chloroflexota bacterium]
MTPRTVEKISVVVVVAVLGAALAVNVRGAPVALLLGALVITVSAGMDLVLRGEARYHPTPDLFILPAAVVVGGVLFISLLSSGVSIVLGLAALAALIFAVFWAEFASLSGRAQRGAAERRGPRAMLAAVGYLAAFLLYAAIYQSKARSLFSAPAIIVLTFLLALRQLRLAPEPPSWPKAAVYGGLVALAAGEVTWALNYWPLNGVLGGAFLLAAFYFLLGVFSHHLQGRLTVRLLAEYGAVCAASVLAITAAGLLRRGL